MNRGIVLVFLCVLGVCSGAIVPYSLECEARTNPVGIDAAQPRLGWRLRSDQQNQNQTAYQVLVAASTEKLIVGQADLWDSGRVASGSNAWIPYAGKPLEAFQRAWWKVRVWDNSGQPSEWSQPARWTTALLNSSDWKGGWIAHPDTSLRSGPLPVFRKEVQLDRPLRSAVALVSGAGFHELRINGAKVSDHVLAPAWTNFRATMLYEAFDVTSLLRSGSNAIGVMAGNGFYNVAGGRYTKYTGSFGHPRVSLLLHLQFEDGSTQEIRSDNSWRVHDGPITFSCIYGGEDYDARKELPGWDRPGFEDSAWAHAQPVEAPGGVMRAQTSPPLRVLQSFPTVKVTQPRPGVWVYDLGQNFAGWPAITAGGPAGAAIKLIPGELLDGTGLVTQRSSGGPNSFSYTLKGAGREEWAPRFTYYGFRYVQVEGAAPEDEAAPGRPVLHRLEGQFVHLDAVRTGRFATSSERLNRIHTLIDFAVRSNLQHSLTDCPHREKLGWLEQTYLMGPSILYNWDLRSFFPKMLRDVREAQLTSGLIPSIAPEYVTFGGGFRDSPEWGSAGVLVPWLAWQWYGDRQTLMASYESMKSYVAYLGKQTKAGLLTYGLGDWYDIGPAEPGYSQLTPQGITGTATYYEDLRILERTARLLGHEADARGFAAQAQSTLAAFQKAFFRPAQKIYATGSQTSLAMPLALGMAPADARTALLDRLAADIRKRGNHTSAGDIGYRYVLAALSQAGRSDVVFDMAANDTAPSYSAQLAAGATSLTEAWDANPNSSQNHFMLGHIEEWFYSGLAGIRPDPASPGLANILIEPVPAGDLRWVKASLETYRGTVAVHWRLEGGRFLLKLDLPPGMTADVRLPGQSARRTGSGRHEFETAAPVRKEGITR